MSTGWPEFPSDLSVALLYALLRLQGLPDSEFLPVFMEQIYVDSLLDTFIKTVSLPEGHALKRYYLK